MVADADRTSDDEREPLRPTLDDAAEDAARETPADERLADDERPAAELATDELATDELATDELATDELATRDLEAPGEAPKRSSRRVWWLLGSLLAAALLGPLVFYFGFWRFEPTAQRHIPAGTVLAIRVDTPELFLFDPFRQHVLPVLAPTSVELTSPPLLARIRTHTGVDLARDVREVVIATPDAQRWALLLGGRFQTSVRRAPFVDGFEQAVEAADGSFDWVRKDAVLIGPRGGSVAQAEDGTLLFTSTEDVARAALHATDDYRALWLSSAGDVSFSLGRAALIHAAAAQRGVLPEAAVLDRLDRVTGWIDLESYESKMALDFTPLADQSIEEVGAGIGALIGALRARAEAAGPGVAGEPSALAPVAARLLAGAKVRTRAANVMVTAKLREDDGDLIGRVLGAKLKEIAPPAN